MLAIMDSQDVAMFRFLLEAYENLAYFTTLERRPALLKIMFAECSRKEVIRALLDIKRTVPLELREWPGASQAVIEEINE